jgi:hypothetical protein
LARKVVYVLQSNGRDHERPTVFIESLKDGAVTYGVKASGSSLRVARERAQVEFKGLTAFVKGLAGKVPGR